MSEMSKRSRTDSEHHHNDDEASMKVVELEAKLADAERHLLYLRTLKLQKLREQAGGVATESIIQAYTDPLIHFELQALYRKHNDMSVVMVLFSCATVLIVNLCSLCVLTTGC